MVFRRTVRFVPSDGRPVDPDRTAGWLARVADVRDDTGARRVGAVPTPCRRGLGRLDTALRLGDERVTVRDGAREGVGRTLRAG